MNKKRFIAKDEIFGYSLWNKQPKFMNIGFSKKSFATEDYPYEMDNACYVSDELIKILMGADFSLKIGECMEITIN